MNKTASHLLRVGLGITFLWIGIMILRQPEAWGGYIPTWAANLLPISIEQTMRVTAYLDIAVGALFILNRLTRPVAFIASLHLAVILIVSGITDITVRDIGLLGGTLALLFNKNIN